MKTSITTNLLVLLLSTITSLASAAESNPEDTTGTTPGHKDLTYAMQKSMDPNVWMAGCCARGICIKA